jgi:hypothetical protein
MQATTLYMLHREDRGSEKGDESRRYRWSGQECGTSSQRLLSKPIFERMAVKDRRPFLRGHSCWQEISIYIWASGQVFAKMEEVDVGLSSLLCLL